MTFENFIKAKLVQLAAREAYHHGGWDGMCAVAQVMANRVNNGWGNWNEVIDNACNYRGTPLLVQTIDVQSTSFRRMLLLVDDIYHGTADDSNVNVEDSRGKLVALYYADLSAYNDWFKNNVLNDPKEHPRIAFVGPLTFFA